MLFQGSILLLYLARSPRWSRSCSRQARSACSCPCSDDQRLLHRDRDPGRHLRRARPRAQHRRRARRPARPRVRGLLRGRALTRGRSSARLRQTRSSAAPTSRWSRGGSSCSCSSRSASPRAAGILLGLPVLRLHGDYLAIVTLGFGEVIRVLANNLDKPINFTNGPKGITPIGRPPIFFAPVRGDRRGSQRPTRSTRSTSTSSCS